MKPFVVFIDDSPDELELFASVFGTDYNLLLARSAQAALTKLAEIGKEPHLIILDVYIPMHGHDLEVPEEIAEKPLNFPADHGELRPAYNNMVLAQERFAELQKVRAHGLRGGVQLAWAFTTRYASVPIVGYSRKSSPFECLVYLAQVPTAVDFIQKPNDPRGWPETCKLTVREFERLRGLFDRYIRTNPENPVHEQKRSAAKLLRGTVELLSYERDRI